MTLASTLRASVLELLMALVAEDEEEAAAEVALTETARRRLPKLLPLAPLVLPVRPPASVLLARSCPPRTRLERDCVASS
jgi:hypothetical protein